LLSGGRRRGGLLGGSFSVHRFRDGIRQRPGCDASVTAALTVLGFLTWWGAFDDQACSSTSDRFDMRGSAYAHWRTRLLKAFQKG
jgi:hypothetical protein